MATTTESLMRELETLISEKKFEAAIKFANENEEKLKAAPQEDKRKIVDAFLRSSKQWKELLQSALESKGPSSLNALWEMDDVNYYGNYIQWLPREVLEDIGMLFPEIPQAAAHYGLFQLLVKSGGVLDLNQDGKFHGLTLNSAVLSGNKPMAHLLLENGANVNAQDEDGDTPLHTAVKCYNLPIARLLKKNGANLELKNNASKTPGSCLEWSPRLYGRGGECERMKLRHVCQKLRKLLNEKTNNGVSAEGRVSPGSSH